MFPFAHQQILRYIGYIANIVFYREPHLPDDATAATESTRQNGDVDPMEHAHFATHAVFTTPNSSVRSNLKAGKFDPNTLMNGVKSTTEK